MPPLLFIDCSLRRLYIVRGARLYFDETERLPFPAHQVEFSPGAADPPVARHDRVPLLTQIEMREVLATVSGDEVLWTIAGHGREAVETAEQRFEHSPEHVRGILGTWLMRCIRKARPHVSTQFSSGNQVRRPSMIFTVVMSWPTWRWV